jgi:hypothetical protein
MMASGTTIPQSLRIAGCAEEAAMMDITVKVWGESCSIQVEQWSKSVWIAVGDFMGEHHISKGRSEAAAVTAWEAWARRKGSE